MVRLFTSVTIFHLLTFFCFLSVIETYSQNTSDISTKQNELKKIKREISNLEKAIQNKSKKEKETYSQLQNYDKQKFLIGKIITRYRTEEKQKEDQISFTESKINFLSEEISRLQTNYAKYVNAVYRRGMQSDLAVIFDSESISQALRRIFYLKKFSERREKDLLAFEKNKNELLAAKIFLKKAKAEKSLLVEKKTNEEVILKQKAGERQKILNAIRKDKVSLKKELDTKKKAESTISNLIAKLIEEKIKREKEAKEKLRLMEEERLSRKKKDKGLVAEETRLADIKSSEAEDPIKNFSSFEQLKGKLNWPVSKGKIIKKFGENRNLILNTITLNYGVDIKIESDLKVKSVSNGTIAAIEWIPGYGSIVIINHSGDYRTVYSHLEEIYVQEGDQVKTGEIIASVGESIEGYILHFEIWNSRENQNPEIWLAKK